MGIEKKIERIKVELAYLIKGAGALAEKQSAIEELQQYTQELLDKLVQGGNGTIE